ncbi:LysR substrate-binding domain-containing protein [Streptomyces sp. RS10V-4]|uniref:LysR family transcriptional regulator n=1 Tax=Streptomyces rhizoryzae TaxID=2932493 RepID=UPI002005788F|nr:LysR substrate-binding domain-containing protein [Streptomyces rhizoryzae]MCK7622785.1 LysR substrate-binding domain-containing protein [Streptomyces rhizoryzae]
MDLLSLRYFRAVARREHISRAAEELRVAQPSVSRTLARLEAELGVPLFDRQGRTIRLNRYGAAFLRRVERALDELDVGRRELADAAGPDRGSLALAAETLLPLAGLLGDYRTAHPGVAVRLHQSTPAAMLDQLRAREVDYCVASQPLTAPGLDTVRLRREEVQLVVPAGHRLAGRDRVTVADLRTEPFITTRTGHWQRDLLERLFAPTGQRPVVCCEGDEPGVTLHLIRAGIGVGLAPAAARDVTAGEPVAWVPIDAPGCHRTLSLVRRADSYLSPAAARFRDLAVAHFAAAGGPAPDPRG